MFALALAAFAASSAALLAPAAAEARKPIAGTTVSLVPMTGFEPSKNFSGLEHAASGSSVVVAEFPPDAFPSLSSTLFTDLAQAKANFAKRNIDITERTEIETASGKVPLLSGQQIVNGAVADKWIVLFKGEKTVMITVQAPQDADMDEDDVVDMLKTVTLSAAPTLAERRDALPFSVQPVAPFRLAEVLAGATAVIVGGPSNHDPVGTMPFMIVSYQLAGGDVTATIDAEAENILRTTKSLENAVITARERVVFAGRPGVKLDMTHELRGRKKRTVQYMAVGTKGRFVRLIATTDAEAFDGLKPTIEAVVATVAFK